MIYSWMTEEDCRYLYYARNNYVNKEIVVIEKKSESYVNKKYQYLYRQTGAKSKKELVCISIRNFIHFDSL